MLGEPPTNRSARLGGIYALARLAHESRESRKQIMQLFAAFAVHESWSREVPAFEEFNFTELNKQDAQQCDSLCKFQKPPELYHLEANRSVPLIPPPSKDVEEAVKQIAARNDSNVDHDNDNNRLELSYASLGGLTLWQANFTNIDFTKTDLRRLKSWQVSFVGSVLPGANLAAADLKGSDFRGVDMRRIDLTGADLSGSDMRSTDLGLVDSLHRTCGKGNCFRPGFLVLT